MSLDTFWDAQLPLIETHLKQTLSARFDDPRDTLAEAMTYSSMAGGKRVRPILCLLVHSLFSDDTTSMLPICSAIEMIHTYSLIHDDLPAMDNDDLRRGKPTCHVKFGEDIAILAGDTLLTYAFEILAKTTTFSAEKMLHAIGLLSHHSGISGMAGGQVLDLKSPTKEDSAYLIKTHANKTGALLRACCTIPAHLNGANEESVQKLDTFGKHIGLLFQITDDILDETATSEDLGKTAKKDADQNKLTYVKLWGIETARQKAREEMEAGKKVLQNLDFNTQLLEDLLYKIMTRTH